MPAVGFQTVEIGHFKVFGIKWGQYRVYISEGYKYADKPIGLIDPVDFRFKNTSGIPLSASTLLDIIAIQLFLKSYNKKK